MSGAAAVSMTAPSGESIADYIHNPASHGQFPNLPGDFEVPSGAFSAGDSIYVFYTTVVAPGKLASYPNLYTASFVKAPDDPQWADDPAVTQMKAQMFADGK